MTKPPWPFQYSCNLPCKIHGFVNLAKYFQPPVGVTEFIGVGIDTHPSMLLLSSPLESLCYLAQRRHAARWRTLNISTLVGLWHPKTIRRSEFCTDRLMTFLLKFKIIFVDGSETRYLPLSSRWRCFGVSWGSSFPSLFSRPGLLAVVELLLDLCHPPGIILKL